MHDNAFDKTKILLVASIVIAVYFLTMMLLDDANIETATIGAVRGLLLIPFLNPSDFTCDDIYSVT